MTCIVALLISQMIKIFVYLKTEKIDGKYFKIMLINENIYYNIKLKYWNIIPKRD